MSFMKLSFSIYGHCIMGMSFYYYSDSRLNPNFVFMPSIIKNRFKSILLVVTLWLCSFGSCKKSNDKQSYACNRQVRYEIIGNFTGKFNIAYTNNNNGNTNANDISLPWATELSYENYVKKIRIYVASSANGIHGQIASIRLYVGGALRGSHTSVAGPTGELSFPTQYYEFD